MRYSSLLLLPSERKGSLNLSEGLINNIYKQAFPVVVVTVAILKDAQRLEPKPRLTHAQR